MHTLRSPAPQAACSVVRTLGRPAPKLPGMYMQSVMTPFEQGGYCCSVNQINLRAPAVPVLCFDILCVLVCLFARCCWSCPRECIGGTAPTAGVSLSECLLFVACCMLHVVWRV